jgi:threonine/homoserine/homoserine lactone efflux protein
MDITHIVAFNIALFAALVSPGPAMICAMQATLSKGRSAGVGVGLGLATVAAFWVVLALFGLEVVFQIFPWLYVSAKIMGGVYLAYTAYKMWKDARQNLREGTSAVKRPFLHGALINLLNPKSALFGAAMLVVIFPPNMSMSEVLLIGTNQFVVESCFYACIAMGFSTKAVSKMYLGAKVYIDRTAAVIIGALGVHLIWSR